MYRHLVWNALTIALVTAALTPAHAAVAKKAKAQLKTPAKAAPVATQPSQVTTRSEGSLSVPAASNETEMMNELQLSLDGPEPAQPSRLRLLSFIGGNYSGPTGGTDVKYDGGGQVGVLLEFGKRTFTLQTGLSYSHTFISDQYVRYGSQYKETGEIAYVSMPLGFRVNFSGASDNSVYLRAAVAPAYLAYMRYEENRNGYRTTDLYTREGVNTFDVQGVVGGGLAWKSFVLDATYQRGFISLAKKSQIFNHGAVISFGYLFDL